MFSLLMAINPLVGKIQDVRSAQLKFGASTRSFWALLALGIMVAGLFAYLYWREWYLERGFRRYRIGTAPGGNSTGTAIEVSTRKSLLALGTAKLSKRTPMEGARSPNGHLTDKPVPAWQIARATQPSGPSSSTLTLKSARGVVLVQAEDEFHEIYVDNLFVGNAPARLNLAEGRHSIELRKPGFIPYCRELQVIPEAEVHFRGHLEPSASNFARC